MLAHDSSVKVGRNATGPKHKRAGSGPHYYKQSLGSAQKKILSEEKKSELNNPWGKKWFLSIFKIHKSLTLRRPVKYGAMSEIPLK